MPVDIGPRIGIDGEKEFRQQLANINQQIRTLGSEMKAVTSSFEDGDRSEEALAAQTDVLNRQIDAQKQKLQQLQKGLDAAADKYGEADTKTLRWAQAVNDARADLNKLESQLKSTSGEVDELGDAMDEAASGGGIMGKLSSLLGGGEGGLGALGGVLGKALPASAITAGVQQLGSAMFDLVESTQEYRTTMASLEQSSQSAGYTTEQTAQTYGRLQSVLGDTQTAATATANLQAIGLSQQDLMTVTDAAIGAWARYGDSIPIDGLAESINETIQAGQVTGTFSDVLNWAGTSEDDFNAKLEAANSTSERANIVMQELANQGLAQTGQAWVENNQDIVAMNASTDKMDQAMARLGETLAPLAAGIKSLGADAINFLLDQAESAVAFFKDLPGKAMTWGKDLIDSFVNGIKSKITAVTDAVKGVANKVKDFLGFSEPKEGPLSNFHTYGPDMMSLYGQGIRANAWRVTDAVRDVSDQIAGAAAMPEFGTGTTERHSRVSSGGNLGAEAIAAAVKSALQGASVYLNGRKVGTLVTQSQNASAVARGQSQVYV